MIDPRVVVWLVRRSGHQRARLGSTKPVSPGCNKSVGQVQHLAVCDSQRLTGDADTGVGVGGDVAVTGVAAGCALVVCRVAVVAAGRRNAAAADQ
jgi:hypothetical protein